MCVKLLPRDLNPDSCHPHPTSTYTCGVTTAHFGVMVTMTY